MPHDACIRLDHPKSHKSLLKSSANSKILQPTSFIHTHLSILPSLSKVSSSRHQQPQTSHSQHLLLHTQSLLQNGSTNCNASTTTSTTDRCYALVLLPSLGRESAGRYTKSPIRTLEFKHQIQTMLIQPRLEYDIVVNILLQSKNILTNQLSSLDNRPTFKTKSKEKT